MPRHSLTIEKLTPWSEFNEYEGEIEGVLDGVPVTGYVLMPSGEHWARYRPSDEVEVDAWLESSGSASATDGERTTLEQLDGPKYRVRGVVREIDGDDLMIESVLPLRVELDLSPQQRESIAEILVGDPISVEGILKVDLDPD